MTSFLKYGILAAVLVVLYGCTEESTLDVTLTFQMTYDDDPLVIGEDYRYPDGRLIQFTRLSFFISDVSLENDDQSVNVLPVDLVNLTDSHMTIEGAREGLIFDLGNQPISDISSVHFNIGLTPAQNETVPADYDANHPLANTGEYWVGWTSYIFVKIEGLVDLDGDDIPERTIALHLGSSDVRRSVVLQNEDSSGQIQIVLDVKQIFEGDTVFDIKTTPHIHSLSQIDQAFILVDQMSDAFSISP